MTAASSRGWGRGWPTNRASEMTWVTAPKSGARWQVHREVAPILAKILSEAEYRGYLFDHGPNDQNDDWGYVNRPIRGTRTPSNHSWGLAVDIDATMYPQGQNRKRPPGWLIDLFEQYRWEWGGNWSYKDPMHFEFAGTLADARRIVGLITAKPPPYVPPPSKLPVRQSLSIGAKGRLVEIAQWELAAVSGAQFPFENGIYWGYLKQAITNLGTVLGKQWDGNFLGPDQWASLDYLYLTKGHQPVIN